MGSAFPRADIPLRSESSTRVPTRSQYNGVVPCSLRVLHNSTTVTVANFEVSEDVLTDEGPGLKSPQLRARQMRCSLLSKVVSWVCLPNALYGAEPVLCTVDPAPEQVVRSGCFWKVGPVDANELPMSSRPGFPCLCHQ